MKGTAIKVGRFDLRSRLVVALDSDFENVWITKHFGTTFGRDLVSKKKGSSSLWHKLPAYGNLLLLHRPYYSVEDIKVT